MKQKLLLILLSLGALKAGAADYYWVNGGGNWSDLNHWRLGSPTGSIPSIVPSASDNVFFTSQSAFGTTVADRTVLLDANGFCNNMSWVAVPNSPSFTSANALYAVQVSGSMSLSPTTTYNARFVFKGATPASLTANGNVLGELTLEVDKLGGSLILNDNLNVAAMTTTYGAGGVTLTSGIFDLGGKTVNLYQMYSDNTNTRVLTMDNATLTTAGPFRYTGTNKILNATGSNLTAGGIVTDGGTYNKATSTLAGGPNTNVINSTTFKALYFTQTLQVFSDINNNNNVDTLVFAGQGSVNQTNTIGSVYFGGIAFVNTANTIRKLTATNRTQITGTNTIDSLLLGANKATTLAGTINIAKYMMAQGGTCEAFTEITAADSARLMFGPSATTLIDNVFLTNIKAYGNNTPIAVSGVDGDGNTGFDITPPASLTGANLYWVGGAGDWNDNTHWSYTSGGPGGACIPFIADTVIFNSASGLGSSRVVTTNGNAYCYNMNWVAGVGTTSFNESTTAAMNVYGSVSLTPAVTMNASLEFMGTETTSTINTNGSTLGSLTFYIRKKGAGKVTMMDNWTSASGVVMLTSGNFSAAGRTLSFNRFSGNSSAVRSLDISNATITVSNSWLYTGANKTINATGSSITSLYAIGIDGLSYPKIDATYNSSANPQAFNIRNTTIGQLTFTGTNAASSANIDSFNTISRLEFKGGGAIEGSSNIIDTLLLAGARTYQVTGVSTINKYLFAQSAPCTGLLEIRGATTGGFQFNPAALISMNNVYLQNMSASGVPPVAVTGADAGGNTGWNITAISGSPRYWIGGSGDWNDNAHWSMSSGGAGGACIPTPYDNVFFDAGSGFTAGSKTVTVNNGNAYCRNLNWANATNAPIWNKAAALTVEVWGDTTILNPAATFTVSPLTFISNNNAVISGSALGNFDIRLAKVGGSLKFLNNYTNILTDIYVNNGTLDLSGRTMSLSSINNEGLANTMGMNISNATISLDTTWQYNGTAAAHTLNAAGSTITTEVFNAQGLTYNNVNVTEIGTSSAVMSNTTMGKLTFTNPNTASQAGINGANNTLRTVEYKGGGGIYATGNVIDTLIFFPGNTYTLTAGTNTTINNAWYGSGTPCRATEILSSSTTANATVTRVNGSVDFDYVRLRRITAAGAGAPFIARNHSTDLNNNTNWNIAPYNGASPIYGLGPDTALAAGAFPYTLRTTGFFGSPSSQYTWNNNSTADTLVVSDTGTYSVAVNFVDGCTISDNIRISLIAPLPVTLTNFDAKVQNCQAVLNWTVADAINFSKFVVERSNDGRNYKELAQLMYNGKGTYAYTDNNTPKGQSFYRLRLADLDGMYAYSQTVTTQVDCNAAAIEVYPTATNGQVYISLPAGYTEGKIEVFNNLGQLLELPGTGAIEHSGLHKIDLSGKVQGTYLLKVSNNNQTQTFKVVYQP